MTVWLSVCCRNQDVPRVGRVHVLIFKCPIFQPAVKFGGKEIKLFIVGLQVFMSAHSAAARVDVFTMNARAAENLAIDPTVCDVVCWVSSGVYYRKVKPAICRHEAEILTAVEVLQLLNILIGFISSNLLHFQVFFWQKDYS